jgi:predicted anti-sigma-YlaC factor YlaD
MELIELLKYLGTSAGWAAAATIIVQVIKKLWPGIVDEAAQGLAIVVAVAVGYVAKELIPYVEALPEFATVILTPVLSYIWYKFMKWLEGKEGVLWSRLL